MTGLLTRLGKLLWRPFGLLLRLLGFWPRRPVAVTEVPLWSPPDGDPRQLWRAVEDRRVSGEPLRHLWQEVERGRAERERTGRAAAVALAASAGAPAENGKRRRVSRRLVVAVSYVVAVAAVAALVGGATYGLFSATASSGANSFTAGTVSLGSSTNGSCGVSAADQLPDGSPHTCTLTVSYGGDKPAYLGLDVLIATKSGAGGTELYNPSDYLNDIQVKVKDNQGSAVTYVDPAIPTDFGAPFACPTPYSTDGYTTCYRLSDLLVRTSPFSSGSVAFTTTLSIPTSSTSDYQGGAAEIVVTAHATQSDNNGTVAGCTPGGPPCTTVSWS